MLPGPMHAILSPSSTESAATHPGPLHDLLASLWNKVKGLDQGEVATYIPELAKANPDWFGLCLVTTDGTVYEMGDSRQLFTIQSVSKPFAYGMALERCGA